MKTIVYTAIMGGYDKLKREPHTQDEFITFVDGRITREVKPWRIVKYNFAFASDVLTAKWYKMMPHRLFPDCDYSLWIDGSVEIIGNDTVTQLVAKYMQDADIVLFKHSKRNCIYDEAAECINKELDTKINIYRQVFKYTQEGYPSNNGLAEATVLLRRHNKAVNAFNEAWWEEIYNYSLRDQISFSYLVHKMGIKVKYFPGTIGDNLNPLFRKHYHISFLWKKIYYTVDKMMAPINKMITLIDKVIGLIGIIMKKRAPCLYNFLKKNTS